RPGDRVRFERATAQASSRAKTAVERAPGPARTPSLTVVAAPPSATVQDRGRPGRASIGLPPSGPLDPTAHDAANAALGNPVDAAVIEVPLGALEVIAGGRVVVSLDGGPPTALADGERFLVPAGERAVRYL